MNPISERQEQFNVKKTHTTQISTNHTHNDRNSEEVAEANSAD